VITLCEECFPAHGEHEVKTIVPMSPCVVCGRYDSREKDGFRTHLFSGDPRVAAERLRMADIPRPIGVNLTPEQRAAWALAMSKAAR
jgi:hypothetical protein